MPNYRVSKYLPASIIVLLAVFVIFFYFFAVPRLINIDKYRQNIESRFKARTGLSLKIDKLDSSMLLNGIKIYFTGIVIKHSDGSIFISANKGFAGISFAGLLKKQIIVKEIRTNNFYANITRLKNGKLDIEQILLAKRKKGEIETRLKNTNIIVDSYRVLFTDRYIKPAGIFAVKGKNAVISDFDPLKHINLNIKGQILSINKPYTSFEVNYTSALPLKLDNITANEPVLYGQARDFYPEMFRNYLKKPLSLSNYIRSGDIRFSINLKKQVFNPRSINAEILLKSPLENINKTRIFLQSVLNDNNLNISELSLKGKDLNILINGTVNNFLHKNTSLNLLLNINRLKFSNITPLLSEDIAKYKTYGNLNASLAIKGHVQKPDIFGYMSLKNFYLSYLNYPEIIKNVNGKLIFKGRKIEFANIVGFIGQSGINISGYYGFDKTSNIKARFSRLNLGLIYKFIRDNPDFQKINQKLKDIKSLSGFASGILALTGGATDFKANGNISLTGVHLAYKGISKPVDKISGTIKFVQTDVFFEKLQGIIADSLFKANGKIIDRIISASIISDKVNLAEFYSILRQSPALKTLKKQAEQVENLSGYARVKILLAGKVGENILKNAQIDIMQASFINKQLGFPITLKGRISATADRILIQSLNVNILGGAAEISGSISGIRAKKFEPYLKINSKNLDIKIIEQLKKLSVIPKDLKNYLNEFSGFKGYLTVNAEITPYNYFVDTKFNRVFAVYKPQKLPLRIRTGSIGITPKQISIKSLHSRISRTALFVNGQVRNYRFTPDFILASNIKIDSRDIDKYINPYLDEPITASGKIPINANISGNLSNVNLLANVTLKKGVNLVFAKGASLPQDKLRIINLAANISKSRVNIKNLDITLDEIQNILHVRGIIDKINTSDVTLIDMHVVNPEPMDITLLNPFFETASEEPFFSSGNIKADLIFNGTASSPDITGNLALINDIIPSKSANIKYAALEFEDNDFILNDSNIDIAGSDLKVRAIADKTFKLPLNVRTVEIDSNALNLDRITKAVKGNTTITEKTDTPPITVQTGLLRAGEFVISNFITNNLVTNFSLTPDWLLTAPNFSLDAANGKAAGRVIYNTQTTEVSGLVNAEGMSANAAATIFLNLPNEVYGTLKGTVQFDTKGTVKEDLISNASGNSTFSIVNGRLTRLGSLEYLLLAANTLTAGIAGINLNSILNLIIPQNTGNFDILDGKVVAEKGILSTDDVKTQGKNLSLYLTGKMNMLNNYSDMTILGRLSRRVSGLLGPLGSLSINTFVGYIPGLGFIPGTEGRGLISYIPFLNRIPLLGLGQGRYRQFVVEIQGDLYDPKSVKSFRWLD